MTVWGQACKSYLDKLPKLQKRGLCFIHFSDHNEHAIPLFVDAHILRLEFVHYESIANLMFDVRNRTAPSNIQDLFSLTWFYFLGADFRCLPRQAVANRFQNISNVHFYNTHSSATNNFYTKPSWLSVQANSFSRIGVKVWNAIPQALRNLSKNALKRKLKQILFSILGSQDFCTDLSEIIKNLKSW